LSFAYCVDGIVTPAGASFTTAGGGYAHEMEALEGLDAEIVECPATQEGFIAAARDADAIYAKGMKFNMQMIQALAKCRLIALGTVGVDYVDYATPGMIVLAEVIRYARSKELIVILDGKRIVAHGSGVGGQMAFYLGINQREVIRAACPVGAVLASNPKDPVALDALVQVVSQELWLMGNTTYPGRGKDNLEAKAIAILLRDHVRSEKLGEACRRMSSAARLISTSAFVASAASAFL
jgi:hypothetical protein